MDTLTYNKSYIGYRDHERGLREFKVVSLNDASSLPPNIYPCMETDPLKAQEEAHIAMHMPDHNYNIVLHFGLQRTVPQPDFSRIEHALKMLPSSFLGMDIKGHINAQCSFESSVKEYLHHAKHPISAADNIWIDYGQRVSQSFAQSFSGSKVGYLRYGSTKGRHQQGLLQLQSHIHRSSSPFNVHLAGQKSVPLSSQTISVMKLDPSHNTLLADSRDICAANQRLGYAFNKSSIYLYESPPLVPISFKTAGAPHELGVHSTYVSKGDDNLQRSVWGIFTIHNTSGLAKVYEAHYERTVANIQSQDFHRRNLELVSP